MVAVIASLVAIPIPAVEAATPATWERLSGTDRYEVAVNVSKELYPTGPAPVVYLASGENFPDALSAGPAAAKEHGVVLLTRAASLPSSVSAELTRLAPARIVAVGGAASVSDGVLAAAKVADPSANVSRIPGADRYVVSATLSARVFAGGPIATAFIASGANFPDALAAGPAAGVAGSPVLLTSPTALPDSTKQELKRLQLLGLANVVIVGGTASVNGTVASQIASLGISVSRVDGADRYAVAAGVANRFFPAAAAIVAATGSTYSDAASAAPLAAALGAPILPVLVDDVPASIRDYLIARHPARVVIAGGPASVSEVNRGRIMGFSDGRIGVAPAHNTFPSYDSAYHDYYEATEELKSTEIAYPDLVKVISIGKSYQGRDIWAVKVSDNVAVDENEPEVMFDSLHHAEEVLGSEQSLYLLRQLVNGYGTDASVTRLVNAREIWIVPFVNPDGSLYSLTGTGYRNWRKNRQPVAGSTYIGTDINRNYGYKWGCCGGSSSNPGAWNYRGPAAWSTPEAQAIRDFVLSRRVDGVQQIKVHVTLHTNGEFVLWPWAYTTAGPGPMAVDDYNTFVALGKAMAARNGYTAKESSHMYITDGDEIDWMYGDQHIFSFTWELYPVEQYNTVSNFDVPDELIGPQTARNRSALLYAIDMAACPYAAIGKQATYCP